MWSKEVPISPLIISAITDRKLVNCRVGLLPPGLPLKYLRVLVTIVASIY